MDQSIGAWASIAERLGRGIIVILATVLVLSITFYVLEARKEKNIKKGKKRLVFPPGAVGLPYVIWDTVAFIRGHHRNELKQFFDRKEAKYGPIFKLSIMGDTIVLLDPPAGNKFLLYGSEHVLVRKAYPKSMTELTVVNSLLTLDGEKYKIVRRQLLSKFFGPECIARYAEDMDRHVLKHLDKHWLCTEGQEEEFCSHRLVNHFTFGIILELCFGLTDSSKDADPGSKLTQAFPEWANGLLSLPINLPGFTFHRAIKARNTLFEIVADLMAKRRQQLKEGTATPDQDLLSVLLSHPDESKVWTDESVRDNLLLLLYAGHDTSSAALTMTISDIAKHPEVYDKLIEGAERTY